MTMFSASFSKLAARSAALWEIGSEGPLGAEDLVAPSLREARRSASDAIESDGGWPWPMTRASRDLRYAASFTVCQLDLPCQSCIASPYLAGDRLGSVLHLAANLLSGLLKVLSLSNLALYLSRGRTLCRTTLLLGSLRDGVADSVVGHIVGCV